MQRVGYLISKGDISHRWWATLLTDTVREGHTKVVDILVSGGGGANILVRKKHHSFLHKTNEIMSIVFSSLSGCAHGLEMDVIQTKK